MKAFTTALLLTASISTFASYESYFPQYFEYCTATQLKYQPEYFSGAEGGIGGHGFMYIHGLCKDYSKNYPQVVPCDENSNHQGVGVSLDSDYANVAWIAVPGRDLMLYGDVERKPVTSEDIDAVAEKAIRLKIFENVKMKPDYVNKNTFNTPEYEKAATIYSIGTDIAVNWARELRCVRVPVNKAAISAAADYLNDVNNRYYKSGKTYEWSMYKNNCTHLAMNTSNAMGINAAIETDKAMVRQIFNLAIPANAYLMYVDRTILKTTNGKRLRNSTAFKKFGYSSVQVGSLMVREPAYPDNAMFKTSELEALTLPRKNILKLTATPETYDKHAKPANTELMENALKWKQIYEKMQPIGDKIFDGYLSNQKELVERILRDN